jgi:hypothetical protein
VPRLTIALGALGALVLAGCDAGGPDDAAVLAEAAKLAEPLPGLYRSTTSFEGYELPGAAAREAEIVRQRMASLNPQVREFCLTPEDAQGGFRAMLKAMQEGDCAVERFAAQDGRLDARMRCSGRGGIESLVTMAGEADPVRSRLSLDIEQSGNAIAGGRSRMLMQVASERIGDCLAGTEGG